MHWKSPAGDAGGAERSVLTREQDRVVREVERDAVQRKVGVFELLAEDHAAVAVVAGQGAGLVGAYRELPNLELLGFEARVMRLNDRDLIEQPVGPGLIGDVFGAVGEEHGAVDSVPIPVLAASELRQVGCVQCFGHDRHRRSPSSSGGIAR
jgi:hypothetical protein